VPLLVTVVTVVAVVATYLTWMAGRLDRLHGRVEAARASLDAQLVRRAAAAGELAAYVRRQGGWAGVDVDGLAAAAAAARVAGSADREVVENDLSRALRGTLAALESPLATGIGTDSDPLLAELEAASTRVVLARRFYNDAVRDTRALRSRRVARWLRLAGHAPLPAYFEIDDTAVAVATAH